MTIPSGRDHPDHRSNRAAKRQTLTPPVSPAPHATPPDDGSTGRVAASRDTPAGTPASRGYPGRERLDMAEQRFRARLKALARDAVTEEQLQPPLAEIIDAAVRDLEQLTDAVGRVLAGGARNQGRVRAELRKAEQLVRRAPAGRVRQLAEAQVATLRSQLVEADLGA